MLLKKKGQSTAEYAIALGLVIAVAAGVTQVILKGAIKDKQKQAISFLMDAGNNNTAGGEVLPSTGALTNAAIYNQEYRSTKVNAADFADETVLEKGGSEKRRTKQSSATTLINIETINASSR